MKVHILTDRNFVSFYFFYPLLVNKSRLKKLGVSLTFYERLCPALWECDVLLLDSKFFKYWPHREEIFALLKRHRTAAAKIVWLDSNASSGSTFFQVLPYVDQYWKKQLLKDLDLYKRIYAGARCYTDFYQQQFGIEVSEKYVEITLEDRYRDKVKLSWNLGVGPYGRHVKFSNLFCLMPWALKQRLPHFYNKKLHSPSASRAKALSFRGSSKYSNPGIDFQRVKIIEKLAKRSVATGSLSYSDYFAELKDSQLAISPFGFGEVCYRDFEIFVAGAALVKPNMDHIITYPDYYEADKTYLAIDWGLENFDAQIDRLLAQPEEGRQIAAAGQEKFRAFISPEGQDAFCVRFKEKLEIASP